MLPRNQPDRIRIVFDDHRLVANAGLLLPATLARHLGLGELVDHHLDLGGAPGRANTGIGQRPLWLAAWSYPKPGLRLPQATQPSPRTNRGFGSQPQRHGNRQFPGRTSFGMAVSAWVVSSLFCFSYQPLVDRHPSNEG